MSRATALILDRVSNGRPAVGVRPVRTPTHGPLPFIQRTCDCTCLLVGVHGDVARRLTTDLPRYGIRPVLVADAEAEPVARLVRAWKFDAIVVDVCAHGVSTPRVIDALASLPATPVILLSARVDECDVIVGLEHGAVDVLSTFTSARLIATKIKRLARIALEAMQRSGPTMAPPRLLQLDSLHLDLCSERACVRGAKLDLPARAFAVLAVLAQQAGTVVDRSALSLHLGSTGIPRSRAFDKQISLIRSALAKAGAQGVEIRTVYGRGYCLALRADAAGPPQADPADRVADKSAHAA